MKKLKHSKFKNTGVLFELLVRQVASDTLNGTDSKALPLIKKYFAKSTELAKELNLYQTLVKEKFNKENKAHALIEAAQEAHGKLNKTTLSKQKYALIKEIKENYVLEEFFRSQVSNYKILASAYKLFEYTVADSPSEIVNSKYTIVEHIIQRSPDRKLIENTNLDTFIKEDKDVRLLSYKILVDKFNSKYSALNAAQKTILREYINNVSNTTKLKEFVTSAVKDLNKSLATQSKKIDDTVVKIKLNEVTGLLKNIESAKTVKDNHILLLLRYHELLKELKAL